MTGGYTNHYTTADLYVGLLIFLNKVSGLLLDAGWVPQPSEDILGPCEDVLGLSLATATLRGYTRLRGYPRAVSGHRNPPKISSISEFHKTAKLLMGVKDTLAERLRRRPAKPMGSPRVGSNPTGVVFICPLHMLYQCVLEERGCSRQG